MKMKYKRLLTRTNRRWLTLGLFLTFAIILSALMLHPAHAADKKVSVAKDTAAAHDSMGDTLSLEGVWKFQTDPEDTGLTKNWQSAKFNDKAWKEIKAPKTWEEEGITEVNKLWTLDDLNKPYSGFAWYRKTIEIPSNWSGQTVFLSLGKIDDLDWTYFNGELVGHIGNESKSAESQLRIYAIPPEKVKAGKPNLLSVRVCDFRGNGGIYEGPLTLTAGINPVQTASSNTNEDIVQTNSDIHIKEGQSVQGDVVAIMGSVHVEGTVTGNVVSVGGSIIAGPKAIINGDVVSVGGKLQIDPSAQIKGERVNVSVPLGGKLFMPKERNFPIPNNHLFSLGWLLPFIIFKMTLLALLVILILLAPDKIKQSCRYLQVNTGAAFGYGLLGMLLIIPLTFALAISCLGIPFIPVLWILFLLACIGGYATMGLWLGEILAEKYHWAQGTFFKKTLIGIIIMILVSFIPIVGWVVIPLLVLGGFGAVLAVCFNRKKDTNPLPPEFRPYVSYTPPSAPVPEAKTPQATPAAETAEGTTPAPGEPQGSPVLGEKTPSETSPEAEPQSPPEKPDSDASASHQE